MLDSGQSVGGGEHLPPIVVKPADRRTARRHKSVLLVGKVCGDVEYACLVYNISETGMMVRLAVAPTAGDRLRIQIRGLRELQATVRWATGFKAGLEFDESQDLTPVFCGRTEDGTVARAPRFALSAEATVRIGGTVASAHVLDISPGGMKLECADLPAPGATGEIMLKDSKTCLRGTVCWVRDGQFGFRSATPIPLSTLSSALGHPLTW